MLISAALCCASSMTELERVLDRVVVGDCDALSSVHPPSSSSSLGMSKWTAACGSGELCRDRVGVASARLEGALSLFFSACFACPCRGGRCPLEWFLRRFACWLFALTMAPEDAWRLTPGRACGLLGAEIELPDCERRWCRPVFSATCCACWACFSALLSLLRFLPKEVFLWTRCPTT
jgi:hypothetical protein